MRRVCDAVEKDHFVGTVHRQDRRFRGRNHRVERPAALQRDLMEKAESSGGDHEGAGCQLTLAPINTPGRWESPRVPSWRQTVRNSERTGRRSPGRRAAYLGEIPNLHVLECAASQLRQHVAADLIVAAHIGARSLDITVIVLILKRSNRGR